ncbi:MAG TPA: CHRD domain-containing protein [Nitrososphaeraceae archaeon]|nr:CHRD domain-containing protein [Nitrososphaeraceae archaeon]
MSQQNKFPIIAIIAAIISLSAVSLSLNSIQAQEGETFSASLSGNDEVPPIQSPATGLAKFQTNENGTQVSYWLNITGLNEITGAHVHNGSAGQNGEVVVTLSGPESSQNAESGVISLTGNITNDKLQGPLAGKELSELVSLMSDGIVYVNVHTGEFKDGAIRGQIVSGLPASEINVTSVAPNTTNTTLGQ